MADIFISYARKDREKVKPIAIAPENQDWSVWWDQEIPPGKMFAEVIKTAIDEAKCVVVLWSRQSVRSEWIQEEATIGRRQKCLYPPKLTRLNPHLDLG